MGAKLADEKTVFIEALRINPEAERTAHLQRACGEDEALLARVESLLKAHDQIDDFLVPTDLDLDIVPDIPPLTEEAGSTIGPYKLLELIGQGGFGAVYLAEQTEPIRRRVALKIIKLGMDTRQVIARFEAERQALAMMDHPNIARVLDAGATESGRPYFVMELVTGVSITDYCDRNGLNIRRRLELFIQICNAVEHAHQKGIIHRDIKPSNVMVTLHDGKPLPKVIDFGIAKAIERRLTDKTSLTGGAHLIGTPAYMSPEQVKTGNPDVDTRTDIYSLGALLYELLTGTTPFDAERLRQAGYTQMLRTISEEEPMLPSARLSAMREELAEIARQRGTSAEALTRAIRGDLDWIAMKSLDKDRTRRYTAASELTADIERHLRTEPVLAGPPSTLYRMKRFVQRRLALVTTAAAVIAAVAGGLIFSTMMYLQTDRALKREVIARAELQTVSDFLTNDLLASVYPEKAGGQEVTVRYILDAASANLDSRFENSPQSEAAIRHTLGMTYRKMGDYGAGELHLRHALEIRRGQLGPENPATLASLDGLGWLYWCQGRSEQAEPLLREAFETRQHVLGAEHPDTLESLTHLAWLDTSSLRSAQGTNLAEKAYQAGQRALGEDHPITIAAAACLSMKYVARLQHAEAEAIAPRAYELSQRILGAEHETTLVLMNTLTWLYERQQRLDEGVELGEKAYETSQRVLGQTHMVTLHAMANLGALYTKLGRHEEADTILAPAFNLARRNLGESHSITLCCGIKLSILYRKQRRYDEHDPLLLALLEISRRTYGEGSVLTGYVKFGLNARTKQLTDLAEERNAAGDGEGAAAALSRLRKINGALEGRVDKPVEHNGD